MGSARLQISLRPVVLQWARERVGLDPEELAMKIGVKPDRVSGWETSGKISFSQVEKLAHFTHTPLGFLYLPEPPDDRLPIPDFRTVGDQTLLRPSPDLLDTVQAMQRRQGWMRDEMIEDGVGPLGFVASATLDSNPVEVAGAMRDGLGLKPDWAVAERTWTDALKHLRDRIEEAGVLVVFNGIVGNNTHRKLNPDEFRGFALVDTHAPLVFINGADYKAAQMFTMVHELVHIWVGAEGVSNFQDMQPSSERTERFCNAVAAEFLVPERDLRSAWGQIPREEAPFDYLARRFKVSSLVAARRALDISLIDRDGFFDFYNAYREDERRRRLRNEAGGDFWNNQNVRIGHRFGAAVVRAVKEGRLLFRDAYLLTGLKGKTFDHFVEAMGI